MTFIFRLIVFFLAKFSLKVCIFFAKVFISWFPFWLQIQKSGLKIFLFHTLNIPILCDKRPYFLRSRKLLWFLYDFSFNCIFLFDNRELLSLKPKKILCILNKASPMIFPKSKSFDFGIFKPPNIAKLKGYFKLNHFSNRFFMI